MIKMEQARGLSGSPPGTKPLQPVSPDRINQQHEGSPLCSSNRKEARDHEVHDKILQFNTLSHQENFNNMPTSKLERKTADAALKRAILGREEAEGEMRRYRDEARSLRKHIEEARERERRVGERLETVMENYGRAKETHSHTQALWEKEIRRARKEAFKSQSTIVKLQEELKNVRGAIKSTEEVLSREKERSKSREQEAFEARYQLVGLQEQLDKALERAKVAEQERDAYKTLAKNEEIARIAAEGQIPLPPSKEADDEFASPKKTRASLSPTNIVSSAASEAEIDELTLLWQWEKQRADRTQEQLDFIEAECHLRCCPGAKSQSRKRRSGTMTPRKERPSKVSIVDPADHKILGSKRESLRGSLQSRGIPVVAEPVASDTPNTQDDKQEKHGKSETEPERRETSIPRGPRRSTIFVPSEGIFRTLSQQDLAARAKEDEAAIEPPVAMEVQREEPVHEPQSFTPTEDPVDVLMEEAADERMEECMEEPIEEPVEELMDEPVEVPAEELAEDFDDQAAEELIEEPMEVGSRHQIYSRTPSAEPPTFAMMRQERTSLMSLLNAPHEIENHNLRMSGIITTTADDMQSNHSERGHTEDEDEAMSGGAYPEQQKEPTDPRSFRTVTQTTSVPLRDENINPNPNIPRSRQPAVANNNNKGGNENRTPSFDVNNPALTPTMTREQALAQIKERRGRARSAAQGGLASGNPNSASASATMTPRRQMVVGVGERRDMSAPVAGRGRGSAVRSSGSSATSSVARSRT